MPVFGDKQIVGGTIAGSGQQMFTSRIRRVAVHRFIPSQVVDGEIEVYSSDQAYAYTPIPVKGNLEGALDISCSYETPIGVAPGFLFQTSIPTLAGLLLHSDAPTGGNPFTPDPIEDPLVDTESVTGITQTSAIVTCTVDPVQSGIDCSATAQYRQIGAPAWTTVLPAQHFFQQGSVEYIVSLSNLTAGNDYEVRAMASNGSPNSPIVDGDPLPFSTPPPVSNDTAPVVTTAPAGQVTQTTATISGTVDSGATAILTYARIEWWETSQGPGTATVIFPTPPTVTSATPVAVTHSLPGLSPGINYSYRVKAKNIVTDPLLDPADQTPATWVFGTTVNFTTQPGGGTGTVGLQALIDNTIRGIGESVACISCRHMSDNYFSVVFEYRTVSGPGAWTPCNPAIQYHKKTLGNLTDPQGNPYAEIAVRSFASAEGLALNTLYEYRATMTDLLTGSITVSSVSAPFKSMTAAEVSACKTAGGRPTRGDCVLFPTYVDPCNSASGLITEANPRTFTSNLQRGGAVAPLTQYDYIVFGTDNQGISSGTGPGTVTPGTVWKMDAAGNHTVVNLTGQATSWIATIVRGDNNGGTPNVWGAGVGTVIGLEGFDGVRWNKPAALNAFPTIKHIYNDTPVANKNTIGSGGGTSVSDGRWMKLALTKTVTADSGTNLLTSTAHGFLANDRVTISSTGTLPGGLTAGVKYYVVTPAANTFALALTPDGAAIDITSNGTPTITVTRAAVPLPVIGISIVGIGAMDPDLDHPTTGSTVAGEPCGEFYFSSTVTEGGATNVYFRGLKCFATPGAHAVLSGGGADAEIGSTPNNGKHRCGLLGFYDCGFRSYREGRLALGTGQTGGLYGNENGFGTKNHLHIDAPARIDIRATVPGGVFFSFTNEHALYNIMHSSCLSGTDTSFLFLNGVATGVGSGAYPSGFAKQTFQFVERNSGSNANNQGSHAYEESPPQIGLFHIKNGTVDGKEDTANNGNKNYTVDLPSNVFTVASHGYLEGDIVQFNNTGTPPGGTTAGDGFFVRFLSGSTFTLSQTFDGPDVDVTSAGAGGNQMFRTDSPGNDTFNIAGGCYGEIRFDGIKSNRGTCLVTSLSDAKGGLAYKGVDNFYYIIRKMDLRNSAGTVSVKRSNNACFNISCVYEIDIGDFSMAAFSDKDGITLQKGGIGPTNYDPQNFGQFGKVGCIGRCTVHPAGIVAGVIAGPTALINYPGWPAGAKMVYQRRYNPGQSYPETTYDATQLATMVDTFVRLPAQGTTQYGWLAPV